MPAKSVAQEHLMEAAAHTPGGYGGVPQSVGKEFTKNDSTPLIQKDAAGVAMMTPDGKVLLLKRGDGGDYAGHWCFPGGHTDGAEMAEETARRETAEETGHVVTGNMQQLSFSDNGAIRFTTFGKSVKEFEPVLSEEHTEAGWFGPDEYPTPLHPGTALTLDSGALNAIDVRLMNELDIARAMAAGYLPSPQLYENLTLFDIRITGTGTAYRSVGEEFCYRDPQYYLNDDFLARCNGLPTIFMHPDDKPTIDHEEYRFRNIGSVFLPYIKGDEVWGIAKIFDDSAISIMSDPDKQWSTSPGVLVGGMHLRLKNGDKLLLESDPKLIDHIAICEYGVWDKGGPPQGISSTGESVMTEAEEKTKKDAEEAAAKKDSDREARLDALEAKFDAFMSKMDALAMPSPTMTAADKAKKDAEEAEEKAKKDAEEKEKEAEAKKDAQAKQDAATQQRIAELEAKLKGLTDEDMASIAATQARADSAAHAFGESAPKPYAGESPLAYRKRVAATFKKHSARWKDVDLAAIQDAAIIGIAEEQIYADAAEFARLPGSYTGPGLRETVTRSRAGHEVSTFTGAIAEFTGMFKPPVRRFVTQFNKPQGA